MFSSNFYLISGIGTMLYTLYAGAKYYTLSGANLISPSKAKKMIKNKEIKKIVDVRTKAEYNLGHYPRAKNVSILDFDKEKFEKMNKKDGILVYCNTGQRARRGAELLKSYGFEKVYYIAGSYKSLI